MTELPETLSGIEQLMTRLNSSSREAFPFERELAFYLLFIAAIWPDKPDTLLTAARIFSGALNVHAATLNRHVGLRHQGVALEFSGTFELSRLGQFNQRLFRDIGGPYSLLFTTSVDDFQRMVANRVHDLLMLHDVVDFLLKASFVSRRLCSSNLAFNAVSQNVFRRANGYGVKGGQKRIRTNDEVTTVNSVREKWKKAPNSIFLSFMLTKLYPIQDYSPAVADFLAHLCFITRVGLPSRLDPLLGAIQASIENCAPTQNRSIIKWAHFSAPEKGKGFFGGAMTFSNDEIKRVLALSDEVFERPLSKEEKCRIIQANSGWADFDFGAYKAR